ncbi:MAG: tRNA (N6-isopentenyl adenosine(37)-C2)-methylthiotransferase MiaB [Lentisphaeria bacterium]|jgi:tRNA-2-methylthio-N6-dimethylallyladenosine synthase|nr:tRNA (N6-isopentenyl adenosine(37)-C2)-methylthiotransferase MiaB [Lentisphaeria bacterium]
MRVYIRTYGCQMNERDSEALAAKLIAAGHSIASSEEEADALIFNTCSVRDAAERKAKGKISHMHKLKKRNPKLIIGVAGCMAQRLGDKLIEELPEVDFVLGTGQLHKVCDIIAQVEAERRQVVSTAESAEVLTEMDAHLAAGSWHGEIAITRGCNRFCSYCIVPYVRGREISRDKSDILREAREMVGRGVREILLLGQNVAAYGLGGNINPPAPDNSPFGELLEELNEIPGLRRIRFTSPYVTYFNDRLIRAMRDSSKVCRSIHLPLQSGSDRILKAMNRQYTRESYLAKVAELRAALPGVTFSTDVIVGFPGETDEDFGLTREVMNEVGFEQSFIFKYSPRPGAKSAALADSVPESIKEERNQILLGDLRDRVQKKLGKLVGSTVEVLAEGVSARNAERWSGRTGTNYVVHFPPKPDTRSGDLVNIKVTQANVVSVVGEIVG